MRLDIDFVNEVVPKRIESVRQRADKIMQEMPCEPEYISSRLESIRRIDIDEIRALSYATWYLLSDDDDTETVQHLRNRLESAVAEAEQILDDFYGRYREKWDALSQEQRTSCLIRRTMASAEYRMQEAPDRFNLPSLKSIVWDLTRYIISIESGHLNLPDMLDPLREMRHRVETRIEEIGEVDHD